MAVKHIISQFSDKTGIRDRDLILRFLNEAASELYEQTDIFGSLMEQVFKVDGNQRIALPHYVGAIRGVREFYSQLPWQLVDTNPRYSDGNWKHDWNEWRVVGVSPIMTSYNNEAPLTVSVAAVENPPVVVTISGKTDTAESTTEVVTLSSVSVETSQSFVEITSITKDRINSYNVNIMDADDVLLSTIPNNQLSVRYLIVDVSKYPWGNASDLHLVEVLFKKKLPYLNGDDDEFPAPGCENIIVNKMMQLFFEEQAKINEAIAFDSKASRTLSRKMHDLGVRQEINLAFHPHDSFLPRSR